MPNTTNNNKNDTSSKNNNNVYERGNSETPLTVASSDEDVGGGGGGGGAKTTMDANSGGDVQDLEKRHDVDDDGGGRSRKRGRTAAVEDSGRREEARTRMRTRTRTRTCADKDKEKDTVANASREVGGDATRVLEAGRSGIGTESVTSAGVASPSGSAEEPTAASWASVMMTGEKGSSSNGRGVVVDDAVGAVLPRGKTAAAAATMTETRQGDKSFPPITKTTEECASPIQVTVRKLASSKRRSRRLVTGGDKVEHSRVSKASGDNGGGGDNAGSDNEATDAYKVNAAASSRAGSRETKAGTGAGTGAVPRVGAPEAKSVKNDEVQGVGERWVHADPVEGAMDQADKVRGVRARPCVECFILPPNRTSRNPSFVSIPLHLVLLGVGET